MPQQKPRHLPIAKPNFEHCYQNWLLEKIAQMNFMTTTSFTAFANAQVFHPWLNSMERISISFHYSCVQISRAPRGKWYCNNCLGKEKWKFWYCILLIILFPFPFWFMKLKYHENILFSFPFFLNDNEKMIQTNST